MKYKSEIIIDLGFKKGGYIKETGSVIYINNPNSLFNQIHNKNLDSVFFMIDGNSDKYTKFEQNFKTLKAIQIINEIENNIFNELII